MTEQNTAAVANSTPRIGVNDRGCMITVMNPNEPLPNSFKLLAANAAIQAVLRITGGCNGFTAEAQEGMVPYFIDSFVELDAEGAVLKEFSGVAFSGGTTKRDSEGHIVASMVTNIPAILAHHYPCVAMSTTPRTGDMHAHRGRSGFMVGDEDLDLGQHGAVIVQPSAAEAAQDWDLDLSVYFRYMEDLVEQGWTAGIIAMNGGDITRKEIYTALKYGFHVIAVEGSLRETDAFIAAFRDGDWSLTAAEFQKKQLGRGKDAAEVQAVVDGIRADCKAVLDKVPASQVSIVPLNDAAALRAVLIEKGFLV